MRVSKVYSTRRPTKQEMDAASARMRVSEFNEWMDACNAAFTEMDGAIRMHQRALKKANPLTVKS